MCEKNQPQIEKIKWSAISGKINKLNSKVFNLLDPIAAVLKNSKKDYVYLVEVPFGEKLIEDGKALILQNDKILNYKLKDSTNNNNSSAAFSHCDFQKDCSETTDYPFSIVIQNNVEIYGTSKAFHELKESYLNNYYYPINILKEGDCFGIWGIADHLSQIRSTNIAGWHGAAGRVCFLPLLKKAEKNKCTTEYRRGIKKLFPSYEPEDGFQQLLIEFFRERDYQTKTTFVIIPDFFIFQNTSLTLKENLKDEKSITELKSRLHIYLLKSAWESVEGYRNMWWRFVKINKDDFSTKDDLYCTSMINHFFEIKESKSYGLRPVNKSDGLIYKLQVDLIKAFHEHKILIELFPGLLIYSKIDESDGLCVSLNSPAYALQYNTGKDTLRVHLNIIQKLIESHNIVLYNPKMGLYNQKNDDARFFQDTNVIIESFFKKKFKEILEDSLDINFDLNTTVFLPQNIHFLAFINKS